MNIADVLPLLSKIDVYADEYIIGQLPVWDTGSPDVEPNNCVVCRVIVYNDGWIVAWFDKESQNQGGTSACTFVDAQTLGGFSTFCEYPDQWNGCYLKVTDSHGDAECPNNTIFSIQDSDEALGRIKVVEDFSPNTYHFNTGYTYDVEIYMSNGNLMWWGDEIGEPATVEPMSNRLYRAIYEMWENMKDRSNATDTSDALGDTVLSYYAGSFHDETYDFGSPATNDVTLASTTWVADDAVYYGLSKMFVALNLNIGQAGVGNTIVWEYWDGSAWSTLSVTDNTSGFTVAGTNTVTFTPPTDWTITDVDGFDLYWIRSRLSVAAFTTDARLTQGWLKTIDSLVYTDSNLGMYSFEDTGAKYCLLCGKTCARWEYFYNTALPGKTIYNHVVNWAVENADPTLYVNDTVVFDGTSGEYTQGHANINIESIDATPGTQNVFKKAGAHYAQYARCAAILITD